MKTYVILLLLGVWGLTSCKHCPDGVDEIDYPAYLEEYFAVYKPGCYFIYSNQDSTKEDSIYITDYTVGSEKDDKVQCYQWGYRTFTIHSDYLSSSKKIYVNYQSQKNCCYFVFEGASQSTDRHWKLRGGNGEYYFTDPNNVQQSVIFPKFFNFELWNNPQLSIYEVTKYDIEGQGVIWFAPEMGIAQYVTNDGIDTFSVTKIYVP